MTLLFSFYFILMMIFLSSSFINNNSLVAHGYPLVAFIAEDEKRCFKFNIPSDDDAHLIFLALPGSDEVEDLLGVDVDKEQAKDIKTDNKLMNTFYEWFNNQVFEMTKLKTSVALPERILDKPPQEIQEKMDRYLVQYGFVSGGDNKTGLRIEVGKSSRRQFFPTKYFAPTTINQIKKNVFNSKSNYLPNKNAEEAAADAEDDEVESIQVCLDNKSNEEKQIQVIFDIVMISAQSNAFDTNLENLGFKKDKHVTPVDDALDRSIDAVKKLIDEMKHSEAREIRMRITTDSINLRVTYFSYLSAGFLLVVAYLQVTYLHRFFHKIKLL